MHRYCPQLFVSLLALAACAPEQKTSRRESLIELEPCRLADLSSEARCGTWEVYEDRSAATGRKLSLKIAVVPALSAEPKPDPIFLIAGGPGQSITQVGPTLVTALRKVHRKHDFVLLDQRGTGGSARLSCGDDDVDYLDLKEAFRVDFPAEEIIECVAKLDADLTLYTTDIAADDMNEVREALGYDQINLWGSSYGTRAALVYLKRHPATVRSVILDAVAPTVMPLPLYFARDGQRALDKLFQDCRVEPSCNQRFPQLESQLDELLRRLETEPELVKLDHPRSGEPVEVTISKDIFTNSLRSFLYSPELSMLIPLMIDRAHGGDLKTFVSMSLGLGAGVADSMSIGMTFSVMCTEDLPRFDDSAVQRESKGTFLGAAGVKQFAAACAHWPSRAPDPSFAEPTVSDVPTLVLSGDLDPVTPPSWGDEAAKHLSRSRHIVVPSQGHGVTMRGCVPDLVAEFIDTLDPEALDPSCVEDLKRMPFFVSFAGPEP